MDGVAYDLAVGMRRSTRQKSVVIGVYNQHPSDKHDDEEKWEELEEGGDIDGAPRGESEEEEERGGLQPPRRSRRQHTNMESHTTGRMVHILRDVSLVRFNQKISKYKKIANIFGN